VPPAEDPLAPLPSAYRFDEFELRVDRRVLLRDGIPVVLGTRGFDLLLALVRRGGRIATKDDLLAEVWQGTHVEYNNITTQMATLRRALGEQRGDGRYIRTHSGRGYSFVGPLDRGQDHAPSPPPGAAPGNLPAALTSFIGREREIDEISARVPTRRLVTLVGPGGAGKTRVALEVAGRLSEQFPDGAWIVDLSRVSDPSLVADALCRLLGAAGNEQRSPLEVALDLLGRRQALLVLDNCEHVLDGAVTCATMIARQCEQCRIIATSREPLGIAGEWIYRIGPMPLWRGDARPSVDEALAADAVRLFVQRANDALGEYEPAEEEAHDLVTICRRLDGLPLAIELAAARLKMMNCRELAAQLDDRFRLLTGGDRSADSRHQTMRAALDWSHDLLSPAEQIVFRRLAAFPDSCSLEGALATLPGEGIAHGEVLDLLSALVDKSLVIADTRHAATRYRMLETARDYALERLAAAGERTLHDRVAAYLIALYTRAERSWPYAPTGAWLRDYAPDVDNLGGAIERAFASGDPETGIALAARAGCIATELSRFADLRRWAAMARPHLGAATLPEEAAELHLAAVPQELGFGTVAPWQDAIRATELFRAAGIPEGLSRALRAQVRAIARPGEDNREAHALIEEAIRIVEPMGPNKTLASAIATAAVVRALDGDMAGYRSLTEQAMIMRRSLGDTSGLLGSLINLAELEFMEGNVEPAIAFAEEGEQQARAVNAQATRGHLLSNLAGYLLASDRIEEAIDAAAQGLRLNRALGHTYFAVLCAEHLALAAALRGEHERAARIAGFTDGYHQAMGHKRDVLEQAGFDRLLALVERAAGSDALRRWMLAGQAWDAARADREALQVAAPAPLAAAEA
jgi:predicted ATPase/DNA-binding winged helix-turn-helix (wHTH) protein